MVEVYAFDVAELAQLELACAQADDVAALEVLLASDGLVVPGSSGQPRLSAVVSELRQSRLALAKLLGAIALPSGEDRPRTAAQQRGSRAAHVRWERTPRTTVPAG